LGDLAGTTMKGVHSSLGGAGGRSEVAAACGAKVAKVSTEATTAGTAMRFTIL